MTVANGMSDEPQEKSGIGFGTVVRLLAIALGIMSALALARDGLGFKLMPFLDAVITAYGLLFDDLFKDAVLALFGPLFALLKNWFDWNWDLYPHWKHAFVLMGIYFFRQAGTGFVAGMPGTAIFLLLWGLAVAVSVSVAIGTVALVQGDMRSNFLIAAIPVAGYMFHEVGIRVWQATFLRVRDRTWWQFFSWGLNWVFGSTTAAIILLLAGLATPAVQRLPSPGLAMLGVLVIALALWNLVSGVWRVRNRSPMHTGARATAGPVPPCSASSFGPASSSLPTRASASTAYRGTL